jgi:hypothetical protein
VLVHLMMTALDVHPDEKLSERAKYLGVKLCLGIRIIKSPLVREVRG